MLKNYLTIALRNLGKQKTFSFINILGLALSMSVCLLIISSIQDAYSYDKFHPARERTYRILTEAQRVNGGEEAYASSPYMVAKTLTTDYSQVELWTPMLSSLNGEARANGKKLPDIQGYYTDSSFFQIFGFELAAGDPLTALKEPWSMVLTEETAQKLFPNGAALGREVEMPAYNGSFKVTGVLKKFPGKSHLVFDALGSVATQLALEKLPDAWNITSEWRNYYGGYNYVRLKPGVDPNTVQMALAEISKTNYAGLELESRDRAYEFVLQPLDEITPGRMLSQHRGNGVPKEVIWFLTALGLIIILAASFNYTNLTIARSLMRTKEVGVRKVLGATRWQVFGQIISEAIVTALIALAGAFMIYSVGRPYLEQGGFAALLDASAKTNWSLYGLFLLFALAVGIFAGLLPASALSKTSPIQVLQKMQNLRLLQKIGLRKALLGFQFTVTLVFFFMVTIVYKQVNYAISKNFGFDHPQTLLVQMQQQEYGKLVSTFSQVNGVEKISGINFPMGTYFDRADDVRSDSVTEKTGVRNYFVDHNYLEHFGLQLLAGENFPENPTQQRELFALVNETFCQQFKMGAPAEAIGKTITVGDSSRLVVKGVLNDFIFKPANYSIEPLLLRYDPTQLGVLNLQLAGNDLPAVMLALEKAWKRIAPEHEFSAEFFDEAVRRNYDELIDTAWVVGFLGFLGMVVTCMGLLGMAMYTAETRAKEVGLRKIMGASVNNLAMMLSKGYLVVLGIAVLIAVPLSLLLGNLVLQEFAQRIGWTPLLFVPGVLLLLAVASLTIGSQTVRAALANPVKSLRSE